MPPAFGAKDAGQDNLAAMMAEIQRLYDLPLSQLASEVMIKGFGPEGPGGPGKPGTIEAPLGAVRIGLEDIARMFTPAFAARGVGPELDKRLLNLIAEGLQILENAALVRTSYRGNAENHLATRRGRMAVERGEIERLIERAGI